MSYIYTVPLICVTRVPDANTNANVNANVNAKATANANPNPNTQLVLLSQYLHKAASLYSQGSGAIVSQVDPASSRSVAGPSALKLSNQVSSITSNSIKFLPSSGPDSAQDF